jgi:hypothetical protein
MTAGGRMNSSWAQKDASLDDDPVVRADETNAQTMDLTVAFSTKKIPSQR